MPAVSNEVCLSNRDVETVATMVVQDLGYKALKPKQLRVVTSVLRGRDVFGVLPTDFGKTLCFAYLPSAYDKLYPKSAPSIVVVVSPLKAIMQDQVSNATELASHSYTAKFYHCVRYALFKCHRLLACVLEG